MKRLPILFLIVFLCVICIIIPSPADSKDKITEIDNKLGEIEQEKSEINKEKSQLEIEKQEIINNHQDNSKECNELKKILDELDSEILAYEESLKQSEEKYGKKLKEFEKRLVVTYQSSYISYIEILANAQNFSDFFERLEFLSLIAKKDKDLVVEFHAIKKDTLYKKQLVENFKTTKENTLHSKNRNMEMLTATRQGIEIRIKENEEKLRSLEQQEDRLIEQSVQIANQIRNMGGSKKYAGGTMVWPVPSSRKIDSYFGMRLHPVYKKYKMHTGLDIDASHGASIVAANKGIVIYSGWQDGYGNMIIIDHGGGITTLYAHCSSLLVSKGATIKQSQLCKGWPNRYSYRASSSF